MRLRIFGRAANEHVCVHWRLDGAVMKDRHPEGLVIPPFAIRPRRMTRVEVRKRVELAESNGNDWLGRVVLSHPSQKREGWGTRTVETAETLPLRLPINV